MIVITSNRGLAGGYNANVVKLITESDLPKDRLSIYAVGNKGRESLEHKGYSIVKELPELIGMSDRILIMKDGQIQDSFTRSEELNESVLIKKMV